MAGRDAGSCPNAVAASLRAGYAHSHGSALVSGVAPRLPYFLRPRTVDTAFFTIVSKPAGHGLFQSDETLRLSFTADFPLSVLPAVIGGKGIAMRVAVDLHGVAALRVLEINLDRIEVLVVTPSGLSEPENRDNGSKFPYYVARKIFPELTLSRVHSFLIRCENRLAFH